MNKYDHPAPGEPGQFSAWTTGAKTGIGRALNAGSALSFTLGKGVLNEVYFPREDIACIRACGCIVVDDKGFFSDERMDAVHQGQMVRPGVPAYQLSNECTQGSYRIRKEILADPHRDAVLQRVRFERLTDHGVLSLYVYLTPHLHNHGQENEAWVEDYKGDRMLFASADGLALAMACSVGWKETSVGFLGESDGVSELRRHGKLSGFDYAGKGNIQLCAEPAEATEFVVAIGFGDTPEAAAQQARSSLLDGFDAAAEQYIKEWQQWQEALRQKWNDRVISGKYIPESAAVLAIGESNQFPGGIIASLAIPWGEAKGPGEGLGYHLVWPRDLVESAWGFLALGSEDDAVRILNYLFTVQEADGRWSQNMWLDGRANLRGVQLDQVALPLLLLDSCHRRGLLDKARWRRYRPGLERAADFILLHGPATDQDRWEQQPGLSPFTLAAEVAALRAAGSMFAELGDRSRAAECRRVAEVWNGRIEEWTFVRGTPKASRVGIQGYYVRINPFIRPIAEVKGAPVRLAHRDEDSIVGDLVSPDALALVRFGLRRPDDPRMLDTIRAIDAELRRELPGGSCWRRFTADAYGEDEAGNPFVKTGCGRSWPLLTGERAHYELAAGNAGEATRLFHAMEAFSHQGLLPEQVWDEEDIPSKDLYCGRYTGSAMPLTWAQAEYIKLAVSLKQGKVFDMPVAWSSAPISTIIF